MATAASPRLTSGVGGQAGGRACLHAGTRTSACTGHRSCSRPYNCMHTCGRERGWEWGLRTEGAPGSAKHAVPASSGGCHGGAPAGNPAAVGQPQSGSAPAVLNSLEQPSSLALVASSSMPWYWLLKHKRPPHRAPYLQASGSPTCRQTPLSARWAPPPAPSPTGAAAWLRGQRMQPAHAMLVPAK